MNSRWSTQPLKRKGQFVSIRADVPGDIAILKSLGTFGPLTANYIAALNGRSYGSVIERIAHLKTKPYEFIQVHKTQLENKRMYQYCKQVLHLTPKGIAKLRDEGFEPVKPEASRHFIHQVTQNQTSASFDMGGLEIVRLPETPIPITFPWKGHTYENHNLTPDGGPIGIGYGNDFYRFIVFETDCASEPLESSNRDRQAIETKLAAYLTVLENELYKTTWDIPDLVVLFTSTTKTRVDNMIALLKHMSTRYLDRFAFQVFPTILQGKQPEPDWAVKRPWTQVHGHLNLGVM